MQVEISRYGGKYTSCATMDDYESDIYPGNYTQKVDGCGAPSIGSRI